MKVEIEGCKIIDNCYRRGEYTWSALTLIEASKECEEFDYPLAAADLSYCWPINNMSIFIEHVNRINLTDENFPIILDDLGSCADGRHRICKAILAGKETIKAKRLTKMPPYDSFNKTTE